MASDSTEDELDQVEEEKEGALMLEEERPPLPIDYEQVAIERSIRGGNRELRALMRARRPGDYEIIPEAVREESLSIS